MARLGAWTVLLDDGLVRLSDEACAIHELPSGSTLTVRDGIDLYAPESRSLISAAFAACVGSGTPYDLEAEIRTASGRVVPVRVSGEAIHDSKGRVERIEGVVQDISALREAQVHAERLDARLARTLESVTDAFYTLDRDWRFTFVNPEAERLQQRSRAQMLGHSVWDVFPEAVGTIFDLEFRRAIETGKAAVFESYYPPLDLWVAVRAYPSDDGLAVYFLDINQRRLAEMALTEAVTALQLSENRFRAALDSVALPAVILDTAGRLLFVNRHMLACTGWSDEELVGSNVFSWLIMDNAPMVSPEAYEMGMASSDAFVEHIESTWRTKSGERVLIAWTNSAITDDTGRIIAVAAIGEDVTQRREAEATQARLVAAIGQAAESIMVTDRQGRVVYANPAFERMSGVTVAEVMGKEPHKLLPSGTAKAYPKVGPRLLSGRPWSGEWDLTRRDGTSYREEVTISPVRAHGGEIVNFVRVARDVTRLHEIQASLARTTRGREAFAQALARLRPCETLEETGQDITDAVGELAGVDIAVLLTFETDRGATVLAVTAPEGHPFAAGESIPPVAAAYLIERAGLGPWAEVREADVLVEHASVWASLGLKGVAYAPIDNGDGPIGLVALGTRDAKVAARIDEQLPVAIEFAAAARSLIAGPLTVRADQRASRRRIEGIISAEAFETVFQPIVRMRTGEPIGFEALTRFHDGTRPELVFAEATDADVGLDLEAATLTKAMAAAQELFAGTWLSLNVSAAMVQDPERLAPIIKRRTRTVVIEVTEHDAITDYAAVRAAIALLGPDVRLAVDDAGAGVANFSHIVSLRPDFVKIDVGLVRGVNHDLTRQALIVGLRHFARAINGWLICEGVETEEERQSLLGLDLEYGQGYLFGRPAIASTWAHPTGSAS